MLYVRQRTDTVMDCVDYLYTPYHHRDEVTCEQGSGSKERSEEETDQDARGEAGSEENQKSRTGRSSQLLVGAINLR